MITAFKHIRLSGHSVTPLTGQDIYGSQNATRLAVNQSGLAYISELIAVSGDLQSKINTANADVSSIFIETGNGLGYTLQDAITLAAADGLKIGVNGQTITFSGNSGYFQGKITNLETYNTNYSGWANAEFVQQAKQQVFSTSLTPNSDEYVVTYPVPFSTIPKVQATLEVSGDVMYNLSIKNIGKNGYTGVLSDTLLENNAYIHTFASNQ